MNKLVVEQLSKSFDEQNVLENTSFTFEQGKIYGLLGRNGAGKTTFFDCIAQDEQYQSGSIKLVQDGDSRDLTPMDVSYVHTEPNLPLFMTGYEFISYFLEVNKNRVAGSLDAKYYLNLAGLEEVDWNKLLKDYSQGMKTKIQLVASLVLNTPILLLDEPLTTVDVIAAHEMKKLITDHKTDAIIIFSTHILQLAKDISDEIVLLHQKRFSGVGDVDIHSSEFENEVIARLANGVETDV